jgi:hypothetical protein
MSHVALAVQLLAHLYHHTKWNQTQNDQSLFQHF